MPGAQVQAGRPVPPICWPESYPLVRKIALHRDSQMEVVLISKVGNFPATGSETHAWREVEASLPDLGLPHFTAL